MSRRTALVAVWFAGTVLATTLAYGAVVLVLAGVSGHAAERLRYGRTIAIERAAKLGPATTETLPRRPRHRSTTTVPAAPATTAPAKPDDHGGATGGSGTGGEAPGSGDGGTLPTSPPGTVETGHSGGGDGSGGSGSGGDGGPGSPSPTTVPHTTTFTSTYAETGGVMTVSCSGADISLVSSSPTSGYTMSVESTGPSEVKVRFGSADHESEMQAHCSGGRPTLDD